MDQQMIRELAIEDEIFDTARWNFNVALQKALKQMLKADAEQGTVTFKMTIDMEKECVDDYRDGEAQKRDAFFPKFSYNVSTTITTKPYEERDKVDPQMETYFDDGEKKYRLRPLVNAEQMSMFDDAFQNPPEPEAPKEAIALPDMNAPEEAISYHYSKNYLVRLTEKKLRSLAKSLKIDHEALGTEQIIEAIQSVRVEVTDKNLKYLDADVNVSEEVGESSNSKAFYAWIKSKLGQKVHIDSQDGDEYNIITEKGEILLTTLVEQDDPQWLDERHVKAHTFHEINMIEYDDGDIVIECDNCGTVIWQMSKPE